jgi:hypothetical protein
MVPSAGEILMHACTVDCAVINGATCMHLVWMEFCRYLLPVSINNRGRNKFSLSTTYVSERPLDGLVLSLNFHVLISETTYRI